MIRVLLTAVCICSFAHASQTRCPDALGSNPVLSRTLESVRAWWRGRPPVESAHKTSEATPLRASDFPKFLRVTPELLEFAALDPAHTATLRALAQIFRYLTPSQLEKLSRALTQVSQEDSARVAVDQFFNPDLDETARGILAGLVPEVERLSSASTLDDLEKIPGKVRLQRTRELLKLEEYRESVAQVLEINTWMVPSTVPLERRLELAQKVRADQIGADDYHDLHYWMSSLEFTILSIKKGTPNLTNRRAVARTHARVALYTKHMDLEKLDVVLSTIVLGAPPPMPAAQLERSLIAAAQGLLRPIKLARPAPRLRSVEELEPFRPNPTDLFAPTQTNHKRRIKMAAPVTEDLPVVVESLSQLCAYSETELRNDLKPGVIYSFEYDRNKAEGRQYVEFMPEVVEWMRFHSTDAYRSVQALCHGPSRGDTFGLKRLRPDPARLFIGVIWEIKTAGSFRFILVKHDHVWRTFAVWHKDDIVRNLLVFDPNFAETTAR